MKQLLPFLFFLPFSLAAQDVDWARFINGAEGEFFHTIATDTEGNVYGGGSFDGTISLGGELYLALGIRDGFLFKASPEGELLWHVILGDFGVDRVTDIQFADNGNLLVSGYFTEQLLYGNEAILTAEGIEWHAFMLWITPEGALVQAEQVPCSRLLQARGFFQAKDGGYYLAGNFRGTITYRGIILENTNDHLDLFILKLSPDLNVVWYKQLEANDFAEIEEIAEGPDEGFFFIADYSGVLTLDAITLDASSTTSMDGTVFKFDKFGQLQWYQVVSGQGPTYFNSLDISPYGDVYLTGGFSRDIVLDFLNASVEKPSNVFTCKLRSNNGVPEWLYTYSSEEFDVGLHIRASPAGGFWLSGRYGGNFELGGIQLDATGEPSDGFLAKISDEGSARWVQTINGPDNDYIDHFAVHPDGALYGISTFYSSTQIGGFQGNAQDERDIALFKIDCPVNKPVVTQSGNTLFTTENYAAYQWYKDGSPLPGNGATALAQSGGQYQVAVESFTGCVTISEAMDVMVAVKEVAEDEKIYLYPNPARGEAFIANWPQGKKATGRLLSLQGQELHRWTTGQIVSGEALGLPRLAPGTYLVELASEQERQFCRLIIL